MSQVATLCKQRLNFSRLTDSNAVQSFGVVDLVQL